MIRPIDIRLNAAHPDLPLAEAVTYTGAPSTVLIRGVPGNCGRWAITAVFVAATFPDGSTTTRTAVQSANGVWVATLPATSTSGRTAHGLRILADGADENGEAVGGYVLGVADFAVASLGIAPAPEPGETSWQMLYFDAVPGTLRKGDVAKVDGVLKLYNGTAWEAFAGDIPAPSTATPAMDGTGSAGSSAAFARGDHVHPSDTSRVPTSRKVNGKALSSDVELDADDVGAYPATDTGEDEYESDKDLYVNGRTRGEHVQARSPSDDTDWCDVATLLHIADEFDPQEQYAKDELVTFRENENWKLYKCVAVNGHTGNWNSNDFQEATVEDILAALRIGKANDSAVVHKSGSTMAGDLTFEDGHGAGVCFNRSGGYETEIFYDGAGDTLEVLTTDGNNNVVSDIVIPTTGYGVLALTADIPYDLVTKTVTNGAVTLDDRASNSVTISATLSPNTLTINFPTAPTGKLRDFAMRLNIAAGVTAPEIAWPQGVTLENNGGEMPEIADGGTGGSSTILYFSESENNGTTAKFTVKGETLTAITQA